MVSLLLQTLPALGGGGPANVLVLANADDPSALSVADHYASERMLPPGNICTVTGIDPDSNAVALDDYDLHILGSLNDCLEVHPQQEELDYLVVIRGLPYRVELPTGFTVSLSAALQVSNTTHVTSGESLMGQALSTWGGVTQASIENPWYVGNSSTDVFEIENPYMAHYSTAVRIAFQATQPRAPRRQSAPLYDQWEYADNLFIVSRLDGFDYEDALDLVDRGVAADGSSPDAPITCMAAADSARGARDPECAYAMSLLDTAGIAAQYIENHDPELSGESLAGLLTGTTSFAGGIDGNTWVPGAFAGNLTSYGAVPNNFRCSADGTCPESESQTSIARFVRGGATFAHGTANEPLNNSFPGAGMFLLSTMGYSAIESAVMTQRFLYWQNVYLGDPIAAPWAERPEVRIDDTVAVNRPVEITATHPLGIAEVRLYVDGVRVDENASLGDSLGLVEGDEVALLAVALAENGTVSREGWPEPAQQPRPDIQGWTTAQIALGAPVIDTISDTGEPSELDTGELSTFSPPDSSKQSSDGGCATISERTQTLWWLLCAVAYRRRRSGVALDLPANQHRVG